VHQLKHRQAEERLGERWPFSEDFGPQLLAGYGASVWRANVALVQTSANTLASMYYVDEQNGEARLARPDLLELGFTSMSGAYGVDRDFVDCLEDWQLDGQYEPDRAPPLIVVPTYFPGRAW
jgi:hypothetical protein